MSGHSIAIATEDLLETPTPSSMLAKHEAPVPSPSGAKTQGRSDRAGSSQKASPSIADLESEAEAMTSILTYSLTYSSTLNATPLRDHLPGRYRARRRPSSQALSAQ